MVVGLYLGLINTVDKTPCGGQRWPCLHASWLDLVDTGRGRVQVLT